MTESPYSDLDLLVGDVLLVQGRLWRITRFTPKRAYCEQIETIVPLLLTSGPEYGIGLNGTNASGHYLETEWEHQRKKIGEAIKLRGLSDAEIQERATNAIKAMQPHKSEVGRLSDLLRAEQDAEVAARTKALTAT